MKDMNLDNKFEFISEVVEAFEGLRSKKDIDKRAEQMIDIITKQKQLAIKYFEIGIL